MSDETASPFLRLFIALAVPPEVRQEIARAQGQLRRHAPPGAIRWTRPDQFHVTLKFLGDVPAAQVAALKQAVAAVCTACPAMQLSAHGIGFFSSVRKPRVIWAGVEDTGGQLTELHRQLDAALRPFAPAEKPERFTGHITLGRFKPGHHAPLEKLLARAAVLRDRPFGEWRAVTVDIVRSELTAEGALHTRLAVYALAG